MLVYRKTSVLILCWFALVIHTYADAVQRVIDSSASSRKSDERGFFIKLKQQVWDADNRAQNFLQGHNGRSGVVPYDSHSRMGFIQAFLASIYVIIISELGDKTFFVAAIMSIRSSRMIVYCGAMGALITMTILSAALGYATTVIPRRITYYLSGFLFAAFGLKMLKDAYSMSDDESKEEFEEVQSDIRKRDEEYLRSNKLAEDPETGVISRSESPIDPIDPTHPILAQPYPPTLTVTSKVGWTVRTRRLMYALFSKVFVEAFVLTFLAEWGDRSQMTTIVLAATKDVVGVIIGGILGHALCTGLAVIAGRLVAQRIPVRWLTLIGGVTFIMFAISTFYIGPESNS